MTSYIPGSGTETIFKPRLWCFQKLDFLRYQGSQEPGTSTIKSYESEKEDTVNTVKQIIL